MNCVKIFEAAEAEKLVMDGQGFDTTEHVIEDNISESSFTADQFSEDDEEEDDEDMADLMNYIKYGQAKQGGFVEKSKGTLDERVEILPQIRLVRNPGICQLTLNLGRDCHFG